MYLIIPTNFKYLQIGQQMKQSTKFEQVLQIIQRPINCLVDEDRNKRKQGLMAIQKQIQKNDEHILKRLLTETNLGKFLNRIIEDKIEGNRQIGLNLYEKIINKFTAEPSGEMYDYFQNMTKLLICRINNTPFPETSEELRLKIVQTLNKLVSFCCSCITPNISELANAISKCLQDPYPQLKKNVCTLIVTLSTHLKYHIGHHSTQILKSLANNLTHQHSKVRKTILYTLSCLLITETAASNFQQVQLGIKVSLSDKIVEVRKAALECSAKLLNYFSPKYLQAHEATLVSYLLTGLSDEAEQNVNISIQLLAQCGTLRKQLQIEEQGTKIKQQ